MALRHMFGSRPPKSLLLSAVLPTTLRMWDDELGGRVPCILTPLAMKLDGLAECVDIGPADVENVMRILRVEWDEDAAAKDLLDRMVLVEKLSHQA
ncbi:unnamed protein product [Diplocarpon coronariae]